MLFTKRRLRATLMRSRDITGDLYHALITMTWPRFILGVGLLFLLANASFALAYWAQRGAIINARPGSLLDAFFFSVQTMATIGYGIMYPGTVYANILMTLETLIGLFGLALATGLAFARFSRPRARVLFSANAVVTLYHGLPTLMFRVANQRGNQVLEARVQATLLRNEISPEGHIMRRFHDLSLLRENTPSFTYSWTVMHPLTETSPLFPTTSSALQDADAEIIVLLAGLDETVSQPIHARHIYKPKAILWNHRFRDVLSKDARGAYVINYAEFHDTEPDAAHTPPADTHKNSSATAR